MSVNTVGPLPLPGVKEIQAIRYVATGAVPVFHKLGTQRLSDHGIHDLGEDPVLPDGVDTVIDVILKSRG